MKRPILRIGTTLGMLFMATLLVFNSCRKDNNGYPNTPSDQWDNSEMTKASFTGQVIQEDGTPLDGAMVSTGTHQITTDADGFFYFSNITTPLNATSIKVEKIGYFKAFKTISVIANQNNQTTIMIMELPSAASMNAATGGTVTIANGGSIDFPANAIIDAVTNLPYTGNVSVYAKWIDPSDDDLLLLIPGALRGISDEGTEEGLTTYGMQAVELVGSAGQPLQLGNGQKASVKFPLPGSMATDAPATIPLWHFDEVDGMWIEEGQATKVGNEYVGEVSHFSYWNCDISGPTVNFTCTFVDGNNNPVVGAQVLVSYTNTIGAAHGLTNSNGTVNGAIPANSNLSLYYIPPGCPWGTPSTFFQTFSSAAANINLGTIVVSNTTPPAVINGTAEDCNNVLLANAPVKLKVGSTILTTTTDASGAFTFSVYCLSVSTPADITAYDAANGVNGSTNITITPNTTVNAGAVAACGTLNAFINWSSNDGTTTTNGSILEGVNMAYFNQSYQLSTNISAIDSIVNGREVINFSFDGPQTVAGVHNLISYYDNLDLSTTQNITGAPTVTLTNYQAVGGWIEGSYTATITSATTPSRTVICSFRVKRQM